MYTIISKQILNLNSKRLDIKAEIVVQHFQAGQFVLLTLKEGGENRPFAVVDADKKRGVISVLVSDDEEEWRRELADMKIGQTICAVSGPYGRPIELKKYGAVLCLTQKEKIGEILPICKALKEAGNRVIVMVTGEERKGMLFETQLRLFCWKVHFVNQHDDFKKALVSMKKQENVQMAWGMGSFDFLESIQSMTKELHLRTFFNITFAICREKHFIDAMQIPLKHKMMNVLFEGPFVDIEGVDFEHLRVWMKNVKEYLGRNRLWQWEQKKNRSGILRRLLPVLQRSRP